MSDLFISEDEGRARMDAYSRLPVWDPSQDRPVFPDNPADIFSEVLPSLERGARSVRAGLRSGAARVMQWSREAPLAAESFRQGLQDDAVSPWLTTQNQRALDRASRIEPDAPATLMEDAMRRQSWDELERVRTSRPSPATLSMAEEVVGGLVEFLVPTMIGGALAGPSGAVGLTANTTYETNLHDLSVADELDAEDAENVALMNAGWAGVAVALPVTRVSPARSFIARLGERAAYGAAYNVPVGIASRGSVGAYLQSQGYSEEISRRYRWNDGVAIATDAVIGSWLGAVHGGRAPPSEATAGCTFGRAMRGAA